MKTVLKINKLEIYAFHGWYNQEQLMGGKYEIDLEVGLSNTQFKKDELSQTVDYVKLITLIKNEMALKSKTIESVGERIVAKILNLSQVIEWVKLEISKKNPPVSEKLDSFSVVFYEEQKK
jgi:dihydroneopterin aldolase